MATTPSTIDYEVPRRKDCLNCGANCWSDEARCWHCGRSLSAPPIAPSLKQFSLSSMLLLMLVVAVSFGLYGMSPALTVLGLLWAVPAVIHAELACNLLRSSGPPLAIAERGTQLFLSFSFVLVAWLGFIAVFMLCYIGLGLFIFTLAEDSLPTLVAIMLSALAAGVATWCYLFWITLPHGVREVWRQIQK